MKAVRRQVKHGFNDMYTLVDEKDNDIEFFIGPSTLTQDAIHQENRPSTPEEKQKLDDLFQKLAPSLNFVKQLHSDASWRGSLHDDGKKRYSSVHIDVPNHNGSPLGDTLDLPDVEGI